MNDEERLYILFTPAPAFHLCPTAGRKALYNFLLCTTFGRAPFTSTSPHFLDVNAKLVDPYPAVPAHSAVTWASNWCSCQLQPFTLDNACSPLLSTPFCSLGSLMSCCHPANSEPWAISPAEFLSLDSALSVSCFHSAPCHEQQLLWFLSGHNAVWHLPYQLIMLSSALLTKIFTFKESSPACFLYSVKMTSLASWLGSGACERIWSCSLRDLGIILRNANEEIFSFFPFCSFIFPLLLYLLLLWRRNSKELIKVTRVNIKC